MDSDRPRVFLSYARGDRALADALAARLEAAGVDTWHDRRLRGGQRWARELEREIEAVRAVVVVLTPAAAAAEGVEKEILYAQRHGVPLIPYRSGGELTLPLANLQYVNDEEELLAAIRAAAGGGQGSPGSGGLWPAGRAGTPAPPAQPPAPPPQELVLAISPFPAGGGLQISVRLGSLGAGPFAFTPPLQPAELEELRWYLEQYWRWPVGPDVARAARLEASLRGWGAALLRAAFAGDQDRGREAMRLWQQFRGGQGPRLLTVDTTQAEALRQPWELLADEEGHLFTLDIPLRRRVHVTQAAPVPPFALPLRVLMVVARPRNQSTPFIDPRASSQALLAALAPLGPANAVVEFLHPPTLAALNRRLRDRRLPPVHTVHFDGHGVYAVPQGLGYLAFEDRRGGPDLVDAERLGDLLAGAGVPLVVLDACQSARADAPDPFTSVAPRLIQAGVGSVVAMQYSVLVPTTSRFFAAFYRGLGEGATVGQAVDEGRRELLADTERLTLHRPGEGEVRFELRDWFLPALYQRDQDPAPFAGAALRAPAEAPVPPLLGGFPEPPYGFAGRARELWEVERLLRSRRLVLLHGFGGQGKTALAAEAARWLTGTGLFARALFLSFEGGGDAAWAVAQVGRLLLGEDFSSLPEQERLPALRAALAAAPTLLVWDNLESVLPGWPAELPLEALGELLGLGATLAEEGGTRLLATCREPALPHPAYAPSLRAGSLALGGLAPPEALAFAGQVLDALGHARPARPDLERLLDFLGGHPLSLQLVLPHLREFGNDVAAVIARFDELYPGFTAGQAKEREESLEASLSFSLSRLSEAARAHVPALGVFEGGGSEVQILRVTGVAPSRWREVRAELERAGLAAPEGELPLGMETDEGPFRGSYLRFHPTLAPHLRRRLPAGERQALEERYRAAYYALSVHLYRADNQSPREVRAIALRELPNLRRALELALAAGDLETAADFGDKVERFLNVFGRWREREALVHRLETAAGTAGEGGPLTKAHFLLQSRRGELLLAQGEASKAEAVFRALLKRLEAGAASDGAYDRAITLQRLGRSLAAQGRAGEAEPKYRRALAVLAGLDRANETIRQATGIAHFGLADVLRDQGRYVEARVEYEAAMKVAEELGAERDVAGYSGQLGTLALMQGDYGEARRRYSEALARFRALGEPAQEAVFWHQLGVVAQEEAKRASAEGRGPLLAEAEAAYHESLRLRENLGDRAGAARSASQLATVAQLAGRPADAERWNRRALGHFDATGDKRGIATVGNNLADLLLSVHQSPSDQRPPVFGGRDLLAEAETLARRAADLMESIGDASLEPWATFSILAGIAGERGDAETVRAWRRRERTAFAAFPGSWARLEAEWGPRVAALAGAGRGEAAARPAAEGLIAALARTDDWRGLGAALRGVLAGERDREALVEAHGLDRTDYVILCQLVAALDGPPPEGSAAGG